MWTRPRWNIPMKRSRVRYQVRIMGATRDVPRNANRSVRPQSIFLAGHFSTITWAITSPHAMIPLVWIQFTTSGWRFSTDEYHLHNPLNILVRVKKIVKWVERGSWKERHNWYLEWEKWKGSLLKLDNKDEHGGFIFHSPPAPFHVNTLEIPTIKGIHARRQNFIFHNKDNDATINNIKTFSVNMSKNSKAS